MCKFVKGNINSVLKETNLLVLPASATVVMGKLSCNSPELQHFDKKFPKMATNCGAAILKTPMPKIYGTIKVNDRVALMQVHTEHHEEFSPLVAGYSIYQLASLAQKHERVDVLYPTSMLLANAEVRTDFNACLRMLVPDNVTFWSAYAD